MAGPGGGPPRKSHTKSRKGCKTCKRRHIRCDETFPACRNCIKHNCRCDYLDAPPPTDITPPSPPRAEPVWTPAIEADVDTWMRTGVYPFPELGLRHHLQFHGLSRFDLRLVYHLSSIYRDLQRKGCIFCTPWLSRLPEFLDAADGFPFVMSAILAFAALNLGAETNSAEISNLSVEHRGIAFKGLTEEIGRLGRENADAILAGSILLLWQEVNWQGWSSMMRGTTLVLSSIGSWREGLRLPTFVEEHVQAVEPQPFVLSPTRGGVMAPVLPEDDHSLEEAIAALQQLLLSLQSNPALATFVDDVLNSAREFLLFSRTMRSEQLFEHLQTLRLRLLWAPVRLLQNIDPSKCNLLVVSHIYALSMAIDAFLPELQGAAFGALVTGPMDEIDRLLQFGLAPGVPIPSIDALMQFPRSITLKTRTARLNMDPLGQDDALSTGQQSPFGMQNLALNSGPTTPNFPPTYPVFPSNVSNVSSEDLSIPPSPFLTSFVPSDSRRHSGYLENPTLLPAPGHSPRPSSVSIDRRSFSGFSNRGFIPTGGESPQYSHGAPSPVPSFHVEDEQSLSFFAGEQTPPPQLPAVPQPWVSSPGSFMYDTSTEKGKGVAHF